MGEREVEGRRGRDTNEGRMRETAMYFPVILVVQF